MRKGLAEKVCEALMEQNKYINEQCFIMPCKTFVLKVKQEVENFMADTQAEMGMGIAFLIKEKRKNNVSAEDILESVCRLCRDLIDHSPECALEFTKLLEGLENGNA